MPKIQFKNSEVFYTDIGEGKPIVLLHGFLENSSMWKDYADVLSKNHRVIFMDLPGHGNSSNLDETHSMVAVAMVVNFVLNKLHCSNYTLIGHSMGGYVAMAMAELFPQNISRLMLFYSSAAADSSEKKMNRERAKKAVAQNKNTFLRITLSGLFSPETLKLYPTELEKLVKEAKSMSEESIISALEGMRIRSDRMALLDTLPFPVAMVSGKNDPAIPINSVVNQHQAKAIKKVSITDHGHMGYIEDRDAALNAIQEFLLV